MPQPYLKTKIYSIYKPSLGLVQNEPSSILNPRASIDCQNVRYVNGTATKRTGYIDYGTGTITGIPIKFYRFQLMSGEERPMLATSTNMYYNDGGAWTSIASTIGCSVDNRITMATAYLDDTFYCVWGSKDYIVKKYDGTSVTSLTGTTTWKPKVIIPYQYRLLMFNIDVGGVNKPIRLSYCAANDIEDWTGTGSASRNLVQGMGSEIMNALPLKNYLGVYKDESITLLSYVGGTSIFATQVPVDGIGLAAQDAIINLGTKHLFLGNDLNIYQWEGGGELIPIGNPIRDYIETNINKSAIQRCFAIPNYENTEAHFFIPTSTNDYPNVFLTYNWTDKTWAISTIDKMSAGGSLRMANTEKMLLGNGIASFTNKYEGSVEPDSSTLGTDKWTLLGTDCSTSSAGINTIDTTANVTLKCSYYQFVPINLSNGFTIQFKAQVVSTTAGSGGFTVWPNDAINNLYYQLYLYDDSVYYSGTKICDFDSTDAYHVYKIYSLGTTNTLYIDDVEKGSWTSTSGGGTALISFGEASASGSMNIKLDYFWYGTGDLDAGDPSGNSTVFHYDYSDANDDDDAISAYFTTPDIVLSPEEHLAINKNVTRVIVEAIGTALLCEYSTDSGENWSDADTETLDSTTYYDIYNFYVSKTARKIRFRFSSIATDATWAIRYIGVEYKERERK